MCYFHNTNMLVLCIMTAFQGILSPIGQVLSISAGKTIPL